MTQPVMIPAELMTENERIFQAARNSFVPAPDDNPDAIPYYADWVGVEAVIGKANMDKFNAAIHNAMGWGNHTWRQIVRGLRSYAQEIRIPEEPHRHYSYEAEPSGDIEARAQEMFKEQFKQVFPGKKINSRFAHEKWEGVREKAYQLAKDEYDAEMARYTDKVNKLEEAYQRRHNEWLEEIQGIANFDDFVRRLSE